MYGDRVQRLVLRRPARLWVALAWLLTGPFSPAAIIVASYIILTNGWDVPFGNVAKNYLLIAAFATVISTLALLSLWKARITLVRIGLTFVAVVLFLGIAAALATNISYDSVTDPRDAMGKSSFTIQIGLSVTFVGALVATVSAVTLRLVAFKIEDVIPENEKARLLAQTSIL